MTSIAEKIIGLAKAEVGYHEGRSGGHWNNREKYAAQVPGLAWVSTTGGPWCAVFVSWLALKAGVASLFPCTASTDAGAAWFKQRKQWSEYPAVPAQVFFGTNGDMYHTGIVYDYDDTYVYTVEGNTNTNGSAEGDGVYLKQHLRRDPHVQGYGYPKGIITKSADPKWKPASPARPPKGKYAQRAAAALAVLAVFAGAIFGVTNHGGSSGGRPVVGARQSIDVFAWNEKSFPVMSSAAYRQDFAKVLPLGGKRAVFLHSEMSAPTEVAIFRPAAKALGLRTYGVRVAGDTAISTRGLDRMKGVRIRISDKLPAPVSPIRHLTAVATATPQPVTFISIHLSNRCFAKSKGKPWYAEQCRALNAQIRLMKRVVAYLVSKGSAVVIGGDQNVSRTITWAKGQVAVRFGLVQLTAVPSQHVAVKMTKVRRIGGLHTDHAITKATVTLISR